MPSALTYPGVYIEEIPSGIRSITGVATSITAFIGRARKGPVDEPILLNSFADYERIFGGLWIESTLSYAVRDFYLNGGSQAIVVRLFNGDSGPSKAALKNGELKLEASSEGSWANDLRMRIDRNVSSDVAESFDLPIAGLFNLAVCDTRTGATETFLNVTAEESPRRIDRVLESESALVRVAEDQAFPFIIPGAYPDPMPNGSIWEGNASTAVLVADRASDGLDLGRPNYEGDRSERTGLYALENVDLFNLLCIPPIKRGGVEADIPKETLSLAMRYCAERRALLIVDSPSDWTSVQVITATNAKKLTDLGLSGTDARNAAIYFPRVIESDILRNGQPDVFAPCGIVAGIIARTDVGRGIWKAPAGIDAALLGPQDLKVNLTDQENGMLNPLGINCLRTFPAIGRVVWGARTLRGSDQLADEYKYIPIRRLALFIEESLFRGLKWVVFEPNDEPLWAQIRLNVGAFMHGLFSQGAFKGRTKQEAYFVKCDSETTTQNDADRGIVNVVVGFAPLKPAEFVVIKIQQLAGQIQT